MPKENETVALGRDLVDRKLTFLLQFVILIIVFATDVKCNS